MDYKWSRLEQKWIESRKLNFLSTPIVNKVRYCSKNAEILKYGISY